MFKVYDCWGEVHYALSTRGDEILVFVGSEGNNGKTSKAIWEWTSLDNFFPTKEITEELWGSDDE